MGDAGLESLAGSFVHALRQPGQPLERGLVHRMPVGPGRKFAQQFTRVGRALLLVGRDGFGEKFRIIFRRDPVPGLQRPAHRQPLDPQTQRACLRLGRLQRHDLEGQHVRARLQHALEFQGKQPVVFPTELALEHHVAVHLDDETALVVIENVVPEVIRRRDVEREAVLPGFLHLERVRGRGRFVIRQDELAGFTHHRGLVSGGQRGGVELLFHRDARNRGHGLLHDGAGGVHIFLQQQGRHRHRIRNVVEAEARVVGRKFLRRIEVHADQVADGVAIFGAVEAAKGRAPRVGPGRVEA